MPMMRLKYFSAVCALAMPAMAAAAWQTILAEPGKRVEIDQASVKKVENGRITALGRIVLEKPINDPKTSSSYRIIEALNRYDCNARTVSTIRRAYYRGEGEPLREEEVRAPLEMPVHSGTLDDKLLREVCHPRSGAEAMAAAGKTAEKASAAAGELRKANEALIQKDVRRAVAQMQPSVPVPPEADAHPLVLPASASATALPQRAAQAAALHQPGAAHAHAKIHWSYEGAGGPENWGKLSRDNVACSSGKRQSPIDIRDGVRVDLEPIQFAYRPSNFSVVDNGHTVQVSLAGGGGISLLGKSYQLIQFHFHRPAEERINGKRFDMVAHLVHKSDDGKLAVLAVLLEQGGENQLIQTVWNNLPLEKNEDVKPPSMMLDLSGLLPDNRSYYTYMGSLTTPPCSEGVLWLVLKQPQQISVEQLQIFSRLYRNNARPVQPAASRLIKESR